MLRLAIGLARVFLLATASVAAPATPNRAPTVPACANPRLPAEIVVGSLGSASPLPIIDLAAPRAALRLAVAADERTRELGLMCVLQLRPRHGMIFVFERDEPHEFWMKNTLAPLDMVWLDRDGRVTTVAAHVPASTLTTPDEGVARRLGRGAYVLELAAGEAAQDGLVVGTRLHIPPIPSN